MRQFEPWFPGLGSALTALVALAAAWAPGCFVTIADPAVDSTGAGGTPDDGSVKTCVPCSFAHVAKYGCNNGSCTILECESGFVDCDGKPDTGCETDFHVESGDASGAVATKLTPKLDEDGGAEWSGLRTYSMRLPCTDCLGTQPGGQNGEQILGEPADAADLTAVFRVAWDQTALYVFAQVHDDQIVARDPNNLEQQDGVELLLNGDLNDINNQYGPDVHHLFVGVLAPTGADKVVERNQQLQNGDIRASTYVAARCYFVEMSLSWPYVMGRMPHTPVVGDLHGFTIAANDWDSPPLTSDPPMRQTQYFWVVPGKNYSYETTGFGVVSIE